MSCVERNLEVILQEINKIDELNYDDDISYVRNDFMVIRRVVLDNERE